MAVSGSFVAASVYLGNGDGTFRFVRDLYPHVMEVFGRAGWDDPAMEVYNELDPRTQP